MSDVFISELLVAALLAPVLIRPFVKHLKSVYAIAILPFIAFFVCIFIFIGQGIFLPFCLLALLTFIICCTEFSRAAAVFQQLRNDSYGRSSVILRIVLLCFFIGTLFAVFCFSPSAPHNFSHGITEKPLFSDSTVTSGMRGNLIATNKIKNNVLAVIAVPAVNPNRISTVAHVTAAKGYPVITITPQNEPFSVPRFSLYTKIIPLLRKQNERYIRKTQPKSEKRGDFIAFLEKIAMKYGTEKQLFVYTEGAFTHIVARYALTHPNIFSGVFFSVSEEEPLPQVPKGWSISGTTGILKTDADRVAPFYFFIQPYNNLTGFDSLAEDDPLAALLLGVPREKLLHCRQAAINTAEIFCKWITQKCIFQ